MSDILRHGGNSPVARMAAGLQLKNQLTAKDLTVKTSYQLRWLAFPEEIRNYIKKNVSTILFPEFIKCLFNLYIFNIPLQLH